MTPKPAARKSVMVSKKSKSPSPDKIEIQKLEAMSLALKEAEERK